MVLVGITAHMGAVLLFVGVAAAAFALAGLQSGAPETFGFAISAIIGIFLGGSLRLTTRGRRRRGGVREALAFLLAGWIIAPAVAAAPFLAAAPEAGFARAYFDAVSAATTTGAPPALAGEAGHMALILWWNLLQWAGGAASIIGAIVVLAALNLAGPGVHRSALFTLQPERMFDRFGLVARAVAPIYAGATVLVWLAVWISGVAPEIALCLSLASVSTGGLWLPGGATSAAGLPLPALAAGTVGLLFGAVSFVVHWDAMRGRARRRYVQDEENIGMAALVMLALLAAGLAAAGAETGAAFARTGLEAVSLAATAAWDMGGVGVAAMSAPLIMAVVLIGGAPVSTAGGVKILRLLLLFRHVGSELRRLAHPSSVSNVRYRDLVLPHRTVMSLLLYVLGYVAVIAVITLVVAGGDALFEHALPAAVAAVANAGPVITVAGREGVAGILGDSASVWALSAGMILGRVDVLAALAALTPAFWRG